MTEDNELVRIGQKPEFFIGKLLGFSANADRLNDWILTID